MGRFFVQMFPVSVTVGIVTGPAREVGTNITASTVVTVVVDGTAEVEAEADLLVVIEAGNTKNDAQVSYRHSCHSHTDIRTCISQVNANLK